MDLKYINLKATAASHFFHCCPIYIAIYPSYYVLCIMHDAPYRPPKNPSECHEKSTPGVIY